MRKKHEKKTRTVVIKHNFVSLSESLAFIGVTAIITNEFPSRATHEFPIELQNGDETADGRVLSWVSFSSSLMH
jgi:hypothetical protein